MVFIFIVTTLPIEAEGALGYALEYSSALILQFVLTCKVLFKHGFDVIHACNPPDNIFLIAGFFKLFGKKFLFDHHDINPELYEAKFGRRDFFYKVMLSWERDGRLKQQISLLPPMNRISVSPLNEVVWMPIRFMWFEVVLN